MVSSEGFTETVHGEIGCVNCHGGNGAIDNKEEAHLDMRREPVSADACGECHDEVETDAHSLHSTLRGYYTVVPQRANQDVIVTEKDIPEAIEE